MRNRGGRNTGRLKPAADSRRGALVLVRSAPSALFDHVDSGSDIRMAEFARRESERANNPSARSSAFPASSAGLPAAHCA